VSSHAKNAPKPEVFQRGIWNLPSLHDKLKGESGAEFPVPRHLDHREKNPMARKKSNSEKAPPQPGTVFESLLFVAVAGTVLAIAFLALALSRYDWALPK
jgi:hypothetical protein